MLWRGRWPAGRNGNRQGFRMPRTAALGGSNGGHLPLRKVSFGIAPPARNRSVAWSTLLSDHAQLAVPDENSNHHAENESNAATDRKVFFFDFASFCMIPLLERFGREAGR